MNKKFLYSSSILILILLLALIISIRYLNRQSYIENKVLRLLPPNPDILIQFRNPDELHNKFLTQHIIFKKIATPEKDDLIHTLNYLDSLYQLAIQQNIHIQPFSFYLAKYQNQWLAAFSAQQYKDIKPIKNFLQKLGYLYTETEGNFIVSKVSTNIPSDKNPPSFYQEWLNIFNKTPAPLHIYQKSDTLEMAYQIHFETSKLLINGFIRYAHLSEYSHYPKYLLNDSINDIEWYPHSVRHLNESTDDYLLTLIHTLQKYTEPKQITLSGQYLIPITNYEELSDALKNISDSVTQNEYYTFYHIKKIYQSSLAQILQAPNDSIPSVLLSENNLLYNKTSHTLSDPSLLEKNFSNHSFYFCILKNTLAENLEKTRYSKYLPLPVTLKEDTTLYNFYTEIFSSLSKQYFAFSINIEKTHLNSSVLWTYQHSQNIENIIGLFDDHKTQSYFIIAQDNQNQLFALNINGEKVFDYPAKEPVKSELFIVDILKNNKHQLLFSTAHKIYLLDRNGNNVGRFPLTFTSELTTPVQVFDYNNKKNYRLWFSAQNHYTYNYTLNGTLADQFRPYYFEETIVCPPYYASVGPSDYIFLISQTGKILGISRKGEGRIKLKHQLPTNILDYTFDISNTLKGSYLYYCTNTALERIDFSDQRKSIVQWNDSVFDAQFLTMPQTRSTFLATLSPTQLTLYSLKGERIQSISLDSIYQKLYIESTSNATCIILRKNNHYRFLTYTNDGEIRWSSKMIQSTCVPRLFHLFKNEKIYLIYSIANTLYCEQLY